MKKRNRLTTQKLHDLVYVKFNAKLKHKHANKDRDPLLAYVEEERSSDWLLNLKKTNQDGDSDDEVFDGETLTWRQVGEMVGANPMKRKSAITKTYKRKKKGEASSSRGNEQQEDPMEEEDDLEASSSSM